MKKINVIFIVIFFMVLIIPICLFDLRKDVSSEIDNRKLVNNPITDKTEVEKTGSLTQALDNYVSDRIGLRNFFIRSYTYLTDKMFNVMVHPTYEYGDDGYVFFKGSSGDKLDNDDFYDLFINMLVEINNYCKKRNVPFYFVFEPSKSYVMTDKINDGINYDNTWINDFLKKIEESGVTLVDNYYLLKTKYGNGEQVFNQKYDAGHWNDLGAFYSVNNILTYMKKDFPNIRLNELEDFETEKVVFNTLPVSEFSIYEEVIKYNPKNEVEDYTNKYIDNLKLSQYYKYFAYSYNSSQKNNSPKTLVFQGSYMNNNGKKFLKNALSHYIAVHNYQNILNFDYFFKIFKPEAVIFEVTEYTLYSNYFDKNEMSIFNLK